MKAKFFRSTDDPTNAVYVAMCVGIGDDPDAIEVGVFRKNKDAREWSDNIWKTKNCTIYMGYVSIDEGEE